MLDFYQRNSVLFLSVMLMFSVLEETSIGSFCELFSCVFFHLPFILYVLLDLSKLTLFFYYLRGINFLVFATKNYILLERLCNMFDAHSSGY